MTIKITLRELTASSQAMSVLGGLVLPAKALFAVKKAVHAYRDAFTIWQETAKPLQDKHTQKDKVTKKPIMNADGSAPIMDTAGFVEEMNILLKEPIELKCDQISAKLIFGGDKEVPFTPNHLSDLSWLFIDDMGE